MLSNFIRRGGKRKGNKVNESRSHQKSPSASSSLALPLVFNVNEDSMSLSTAQTPLWVKLNLSDSNEDWFPQELLRSRSCSPASSLPCTQNDKVAQNNLTQVTRADPSPAPLPSHSEDPPPRVAIRKKSIPAPILIPDAEVHVPNIQIGHSAVSTAVPAPETSQPNVNDASLIPPSPSASDDLSAISGTTLARALIASSFVLSSSERRSSRHRSVVRQDSATLPCRESVFQSDSRRSPPIPPVPPVPAVLVSVPSNPNYTSTIKSGASTESEYPMSDSYITSPEIVLSSAIPRRISHTQEIPSQTASASTDASPPVVSDMAPKEKTGPVPARTRVIRNGVFDGPKTAVEVPLSVNALGMTRYSSQEGSFVLSSDDHSLDEFDFVPPEPLVVIASASSDSSASYSAPLRKRCDTKRKRRVGGSNFVRNGSKDHSDSTLSSHQDHSMPSATMSENDYGELLHYDLTVSPGSSSSSHMLSGGSAGYQTFPETPMVFSPLWSPAYALLSKSDGQMLRTHPLTPKSARLGSRKLFSTVRRQVDNNNGVGGVLRRSQSSLLPRQEMPSPKQPKSNLPPSAQVNDEEGVPDEMDQLLTVNMVESQNPVNLQATVRPLPLAHISTSSSCLPEDEALRALARHSSSSLPSFVIGDVDAPPNPMPVPVPVIDPFVESSTSISFLESSNGSPLNSPALAGSATAASSSTTPPQSPVPSTTTAVSQPKPSKFPLSVASLFLEEPFLPSPPPPAPSDEPLSESLFPIQIVSSSGASDVSISPSFFPPPPYYAVVSERTAYHPGSISPPSLSSTSSSDPGYQRSRQISNSSMTSGSIRSRGRTRPAAPIGPRKPSGPGQILGSFVPEVHGRNGSISSLGSGDPTGRSGSPWHSLQAAASKPPPKFQMPPPKWRGLTLEAAQWTFTSAQLQEVVSRAIQQSSECSAIRLLRLEVLEGEIADEMHRLELQHTDVKAQYKALVRKRWTLMGTLASQIEGVETNDASRTMEALAEVLLALDHVADRMHVIVLQMSQLKSLRDVHYASALALAVRKINGVFVRQMAEKERLQERLDTLRTERDEAWKHAEDIARDYDTLSDRVSETVVNGDTQSSSSSSSSSGVTNNRSKRISAVRNSSIRMSRAGLRSRSRHRSNATHTRPSSLTLPLEDTIPPVPRVMVSPADRSALSTGMSFGSTCSYYSNTSEAMALAVAQQEVYEILGLSVPPSQASSRRRTMSSPGDRVTSTLLQAAPRRSLSARRTSESFSRVGSYQERGRATESVVLQ